MLCSWCEFGGEVSLNIVWQYVYIIIFWYLCDMVVIEYGIVDLCGKNDVEVIVVLLVIVDLCFQQVLVEQVQLVGKLLKDFVLFECYCNNILECLQVLYQVYVVVLLEFFLGSDFDEVEQDLLWVLGWFKCKLKLSEIFELGKVILDVLELEVYLVYLWCMDLDDLQGFCEEFYQCLLLVGL